MSIGCHLAKSQSGTQIRHRRPKSRRPGHPPAITDTTVRDAVIEPLPFAEVGETNEQLRSTFRNPSHFRQRSIHRRTLPCQGGGTKDQQPGSSDDARAGASHRTNTRSTQTPTTTRRQPSHRGSRQDARSSSSRRGPPPPQPPPPKASSTGSQHPRSHRQPKEAKRPMSTAIQSPLAEVPGSPPLTTAPRDAGGEGASGLTRGKRNSPRNRLWLL
jgi:hypothetical protein